MTSRRTSLIILFQGFWFLLVMGLGLWWSRLALRLTGRVEGLERQLGLPPEEIARNAESLKRMLFWESGTYLILVIVASAALIALYWRHRLRAKSLQAFFAAVTHELKTPLTSIRLQVESLQEELPVELKKSRTLSRLFEDTMRLEAQVERALELARVEGGGGYHPHPLRLKPFVDSLLRPWQEAQEGRVTFINAIADEEVTADTTALGVILRNLVENALRHGAATTVRLSCRAEGDRLCLLVEDTGRGFEGKRHDLGRLYHKGPRSSGAGVGLYLVRALMGRMGGDAFFENAASSGFRAVLRFAPMTVERSAQP